MTRLAWDFVNNNVLILISVILATAFTAINAYPHNIKDAAQHTPIRNLSEMDEDLTPADTDAEFESRKIETVIPTLETQEPTPDSQHFFPSFTSIFNNHPLGHSRPPIFDDPPNNHRARHIPYALQQANSFQGTPGNNNFNSYQASQPKSSVTSSSDNSVLGSGNFGVIRGGTFYEDDYDSNDDYFYPYNGNGHGRPTNNYFNHQPAHASNNGDFFANFRDFADITAPKSAYSEFHIIYVNKNGTEVHINDKNNENVRINDKPRNIFEQLTKLDESDSKLKLKKKGINSKEKLAAFKEKENDKLYKKKQSLKSPKDFYRDEPLLALS